MRKIFTLFFFLISVFSFSQSWDWAKRFGGKGTDRSYNVTVDKAENVYISGAFSDTVQFGANQFVSNGVKDVFIAKLDSAGNDSAGNVLWAKQFGGIGDDECYIAKIDDAGNIIIGGSFKNTILLGSFTLTSAGAEDIFIAKLNSIGSVIWAKSSGGVGAEYPMCINLDNLGNSYVCADFNSPSVFFGTYQLFSSGNYDITLIKYDSSGNVIWAKRAGGTGLDAVIYIEVDTIGFFYITGSFQNTANFDTLTVNGVGGGSDDMFVAKYDTSGKIIWFNQAGGNGQDQGSSVHFDANRNVYVAGSFSSPNNFNFGPQVLSSYGSFDIFLAKYDSLGNFIWAKKAGSPSDDVAWLMDMDKSANCYLTGYYGNTSTFDTITIYGVYDMYVAKYDSSGKALWVKTATGAGSEYGAWLSVVNNNIYVTGHFVNDLFCDSTTLSSAGMEDIWIGKIIQPQTGNAVNEISSAEDFMIYPNPTSGQFTVSGLQFPVEIQIYNLLGEQVLETTVNRNKQTINLRAASGLYIVQIKTEKDFVTKKIIKQ